MDFLGDALARRRLAMIKVMASLIYTNVHGPLGEVHRLSAATSLSISIGLTMSLNQNEDADRVRTAVADRNVAAISERVAEMQFLLIHVADSSDPEDELGALTADIDDQPCLVAFTSEENAAAFVQQHPEVFAEGEEVSGMLVDGATMLDYLGDDYGLLIDPETESGAYLDRELVGDLLDELDVE